MSITNVKSKILGDFLKTRRERMKPDPSDVVGRLGRRRTPGLRREEVAHLAGVSLTWYTWLEQGRVVTVSKEVIISVARALQLSSEEYMHLLGLANYAGERELSPKSEEVYEGIQGIIDQLNCPAIITNHRTEVLAYNRLATEIIIDFRGVPTDKRVMTWILFSDPQLRKRLVNWDEFAKYTAGRFRSSYDQEIGDPWFDKLTNQLCEESEEFQAFWRLHDVQQKKSIPYTLEHPAAGRLFFELTSFSNINGNANLHCCIFTPVAGTDTERRLADIQK
ncbi:transcriptional regulator with XRE-family HTH domain [Paenibacillus phyllosphaerae]|uniref:Transcriptional regulator with XRE-family HTH domain n=1 Tax=Paenibacillus phyllosphaerae TaxID=274593 RepID=A0A7W5B5G8_9BACL|nr:helix-turn-helix transcriptional regulator [Paenibacillus phyllosphaerae]MBB3114783.1 transcriptional regulator with XRE-family HTH domain [Paenibacillus phyllosphaerae]